MRMLSAVLAVAVVLAIGAKLAAQEVKTRSALVESLQDLNLTDDQEAKIADIVKEFRTKNAEAVKELASVIEKETDKVNAVLTAEQKEIVKSLREERKDSREECLAHRIANLKDLDLTDGELTKVGEIRAEFRPKIVKAMKPLEGILNAEQRAIREDGLKAGKKRREILASLKFTDAQKETAAAVGKEVGGLVRDEAEKIRDVLTATQKEELQDLKDERREHVRDRLAHRITNLESLNLTDDQKSKLAEIRKEYRPKVQEAGNKLRASVRDEIGMIVAVIKG